MNAINTLLKAVYDLDRPRQMLQLENVNIFIFANDIFEITQAQMNRISIIS